MSTVNFKKTAFIKYILSQYHDTRTVHDMEMSIMESDSPHQSWFYTLGITDKSAVIHGLSYPTTGGLSELSNALLSKDGSESTRQDIQYFNFVYNTCNTYIQDNQNRYFGSANLSDIKHGKVFAMTLIAHMCKKALEASSDKEREKYKDRIIHFTTFLLEQEQIQSTKSLDTSTLSCKSALNRIFNAKEKVIKDENRLLAFYEKVDESIVNVDRLLTRLNDYTLPLITLEKQATQTVIESLAAPKHTLSSTEKSLAENSIVQEGYIEALKNIDENFTELFNGKKYKLNHEENFLLNHFTKEQQLNFANMLRARDKLTVILNELARLKGLASSNKVGFFNDFLKLSQPYLHALKLTQQQLEGHIAQFDADCGEVYRKRQEDKGWFGPSTARTNWEARYFEKTKLSSLKEQLRDTSHAINEVFTSIPYDYYNALKKLSEKVEDVKSRGIALFGKSYWEDGSDFNTQIHKAQEHELQRQAQLILTKQKSISQEYADLITRAKKVKDISLIFIEDLVRRKKAVDTLIDTLSETSERIEDGFVLIDINDDKEDHYAKKTSSEGFLSVALNYLRGREENQQKEIALEKMQKENERLLENVSSLEEKMQHNETLLKEKTQRFERKNTITENYMKIKEKLEETFLELGLTSRGILGLNQLIKFGAKTEKGLPPTCYDDKGMLIIADDEIQADSIEQIKNITSNYHQLIERLVDYNQSYKDFITKGDKRSYTGLSPFRHFHGQTGIKNANTNTRQWISQAKDAINKAISEQIANHVKNLDEEDISPLNEKIQTAANLALQDQLSNLFKQSKQSGLGRHSFNNYLLKYNDEIKSVLQNQLDEALDDTWKVNIAAKIDGDYSQSQVRHDVLAMRMS
jgi:hypothetical protein